jgi:hypothetical protein
MGMAPRRGSRSRKPAPEESNVVQMHEAFLRPDRLVGSTYKVKTPLSEHAMYITINDVILNEGTEHESRRPFEVFINSKNMEHFQWVVALTRLISAIFRKGGDATFLVEELKAVFDPKWRLLQERRRVHALDRGGDRLRHRGSHEAHRPDPDRPRQAPAGVPRQQAP